MSLRMQEEEEDVKKVVHESLVENIDAIVQQVKELKHQMDEEEQKRTAQNVLLVEKVNQL